MSLSLFLFDIRMDSVLLLDSMGFSEFFLGIASLDVAQVTVILLRGQTPGGNCLQLRKNKSSPIFSFLLKNKLLRGLDRSLSLIDHGTNILTVSQCSLLGSFPMLRRKNNFQYMGLIGPGPSTGCP